MMKNIVKGGLIAAVLLTGMLMMTGSASAAVIVTDDGFIRPVISAPLAPRIAVAPRPFVRPFFFPRPFVNPFLFDIEEELFNPFFFDEERFFGEEFGEGFERDD